MWRHFVGMFLVDHARKNILYHLVMFLVNRLQASTSCLLLQFAADVHLPDQFLRL